MQQLLRYQTESEPRLSPVSSGAAKLSNKESRLEWPSFIKHLSCSRRFWGERRGAGVFTPRLSRGPQDTTDEDLCSYSFPQLHTVWLSAQLGLMLGCTASLCEAVFALKEMKPCEQSLCLRLIWPWCVILCFTVVQEAPARILTKLMAPLCGEMLYCA